MCSSSNARLLWIDKIAVSMPTSLSAIIVQFDSLKRKARLNRSSFVIFDCYGVAQQVLWL